MKPLTLDESTDTELPETLQILVQSVLEDERKDRVTTDDDKVINHLFVVLLCTIMMECGFSLVEASDQTKDHAYVLGFDVRRMRSVRRMPHGWWSERENVYKLKFNLLPDGRCPCLLTVLPLSWATVVNIVVPDETVLDHVLIFPAIRQYVKSSSGVFADLRGLSCKFKEAVVFPVRNGLLVGRGMASVQLESLPTEVLLCVLTFFDHCDLCRLAQTCHRLRDLCEDESLWKELCIKKFGLAAESNLHGPVNGMWRHTFKFLWEGSPVRIRSWDKYRQSWEKYF